jgi:polyisoprenoid-binding protein YceI
MISTVKGRFADVQGTIRMDEADPSAVLVDATIGAASIDTRQEERDAHLRSTDFFDVARFPTIFFRSRRVQGTRSKATSGSSATSPSAKPRAR